MYTIRNSNTGQQTTCTDKAHVRRILRSIVAKHGKPALKGIYVDRAVERDPFHAEDMQL